MRSGCLLVFVLATTLATAAGLRDAKAFTERSQKANTSSSDIARMSPYSLALIQLIHAEIKRTDIPFGKIAPRKFTVKFYLNRRGEVVEVKVIPDQPIPDVLAYFDGIVRRASRHFTPPPVSLAGKRVAFVFQFHIS